MNDEEFARILQAKFDAEDTYYRSLESKSETDTDATGSAEDSGSFEDATSLTSKSEETCAGDSRPLCKYGSECFRKSQSHLNEFRHTAKRKSDTADGPAAVKKARLGNGTKKSACEIVDENQPFSFYLTKVTGIDHKYNEFAAINIKDILSPSMGKLKESCQFSFMIDINWLMNQYSKEFRNLPLLIVHGKQRAELATFLSEASPYPNITCCQAKLEMYGTHHSKMMFLLYDNGMRVVIHTANLVEGDWYQKTQGVWVSPLFPKLAPGATNSGANIVGDSPTHFKEDLLEYLESYRSPKMKVWEKHIHSHDMSSAKVYIIGSVPGRHTSVKKNSFGHLKLRKVLQENGPDAATLKNWPVIGQFSSIGSLGSTKDTWLCKEWLQSLSAARGLSGPTPENNLLLVFPSVNNVRSSLEGYMAGGSIPYHFKTAKKQLYLHQFFRQWKSEGRGRSCASPHIKTYIRPSPDFTEAAWFLVTSANLSKAAWGAFEKNCSQLMIRSYEIGVLFLPKYFGTLKLTTDAEAAASSSKPLFPLPYDLPLTRYNKGDRPWMVDIPCVDLPDTHGIMWCPPVDDL
ncbi:tyrosyl-DNA phosphodiesterase 1-like isoform X2 [Gigantopelta aegis]|uniref:tyrosyl-DNA phosphodiesterase 1-like isoform X2 n=1 Tax=Gigantopelta aegis TaxID=1735272 RepID=UPI001B88AFA1|nr:tyrosyl-DNA phosphodiesterase 1-like isoform X2 [Gigantopelta aegis]